jgi:hypothetical protein
MPAAASPMVPSAAVTPLRVLGMTANALLRAPTLEARPVKTLVA